MTEMHPPQPAHGHTALRKLIRSAVFATCSRRSTFRTSLLTTVAVVTTALATPALAQVMVTGDVTPDPWTPADLLRIGETAFGQVTVQGGSTTASSSGMLGDYDTADGVAIISGSGSRWDITNTLMVGNRGSATLQILDGGVVTTGNWMDINYSSDSGAAVHVTGVDAFGNASTLQVGAELTVGYYNGESDAILMVTEGGKVISASGQIGFGAGSNAYGHATVSGSDGAGNVSTWENAGELAVGAGNFGTGLLDITDGGKVISASGVIGKERNSEGEVIVTGTDGAGNISTWEITGNLVVGNSGSGLLLILDGGKVSNVNGTIGAAEDGDYSVVSVLGTDGAGNVSTWENSGSLTVGEDAWGRLYIEDGGKVTSNGAVIGSNSFGDVLVLGTDGDGNISTWENSGNLVVGGGDAGFLTIEEGGSVTSDSVDIASASGSGGSVTVSGTDGAGAASALEVSSSLNVGVEGEGYLTIEDGGRVESFSGYVADQDGSTGEVTISGTDGAGNASIWHSSITLQIGRRGIGELTVTNGGIVATDASSTIVLGAASSGSGDGTLNIGAKSGEAAAAAGEVRTGALGFGNGIATLVFNHTDEIELSARFYAAGVGTHTLKHEAGVTTLTGDSAGWIGTTDVSGGTLIVGLDGVGSLATSNITVGGAGTLKGTGALGGLTVQSGGVHAPGNSIGTQTVNGPYILQAGAILEIEANAAGQSDVVVVNGTVDLTGATLRVLAESGTYAATTEYLIIDNDGVDVVTGAFATITSNFTFLDPTVIYDGGDGNDVVLTLTRNNVEFTQAARTPNQHAVANTLNQLPLNNPLVNAVVVQSEEGARQAFDALSGEVYASVSTMLANDSRFTRGIILSRLQQASASGAQAGGRQTASAGSGTPFAVAGSFDAPMALGMGSGRPAPGYGIPAAASPLVFWTQGFGSWGDFDGDGNAASVNRTIGGFLSGADASMGYGWRAGLAFGYSHSSVGVGARLSSADVDSYHLSLYTGGMVGAVALRAGGVWSWNDIDTNRAIAFPGFFDRTESSTNGDVGQIFAEAALPLSTGLITYEPFANLAYVHVSTDRFAEQGGAAALNGFGDSNTTGFTTLGLRLAANAMLGDARIGLRASFGWQYAFGDIDPLQALAFNGGGPAFGIAGVPLARNAALIDAGFDVFLTPDATLSLSYNGELAKDIEDHGVSGRLNWRF